jgi:hypothetical protein
VWGTGNIRRSKRDKHVDRLPLQLSSSLSGREKREPGSRGQISRPPQSQKKESRENQDMNRAA